MQGLSPIAGQGCKVLILGSFPGAESRRLREYYAHRQNSFWRLMFSLFTELYSSDYEVKKALLLRHGVALWDVLYSHEGAGSADSAIKNPVPNDFSPFFRRYPGISHIFFNGAAAEKLFFALIDRTYVPGGIPFTRLYSSSPANARFSFEEKLQNWSRIKDALGKP